MLFHKFEVSPGSSNSSLKNYGFICNDIFFICTHAHKELNNEHETQPGRTDLLLCDGKLQLKHAPAAKTCYINKLRLKTVNVSHCLVTDCTLIKSVLFPSTYHIKYWPTPFTIEPVKSMKCYLLIKTVLY